MAAPFPFSAIVGQDEMKLAILIAAVDPSIGGVLVFGDRGTGKSTAVRALAANANGMAGTLQEQSPLTAEQAGLMLRAEGQGGRLSRAADQPVWRDPETGYLRRQVFVDDTRRGRVEGHRRDVLAVQIALHRPDRKSVV